MGIGAENSANLYSCMGYYANSPSEGAKKFKAEYMAKYGDKAPQLATIGADCYSALNLAKAMFDKAGSHRREEAHRGVRGPARSTAPQGRSRCTAARSTRTCTWPSARAREFEVIKTIKAVKSGTACKV